MSSDDKKKTESKEPKKKDKVEELSEEDLAKKAELELLVERVQDTDAGVAKLALETMRSEIRSATSSMTSVPKPLKFLRPHYPALKEFFLKLEDANNKQYLADILSVLAMTMADDGSRESLKYKLAGCRDELGSWGHEYVRNLAGEIGSEWSSRVSKGESIDDLSELVNDIVPFHMRHNSEPEACDLLMECDCLSRVMDLVDDNNYQRVALYLMSCASYVPEPEDIQIIHIVYDIYVQRKRWLDAMRVAIKLDDKERINSTFAKCTDDLEKKQLAFLLARQQIQVEGADDSITEILNNTMLHENYLALARDLDVMEPKAPEDIYRSHLVETRGGLGGQNVDSARQNLASTIVNSLVNAGFCTDKLMTVDGNKWLYKNKEHGMMSATASLGMLMLWDVDDGLTQIDKYLYSNEEYIKAGALLAVGIVNSGVRNECDPALALLSEALDDPKPTIRMGAVLGLGLAYAGSQREELMELLMPIVADASVPTDLFGLATLSLAYVFVGSGHAEIAQTILLALLERDEGDGMTDSMGRFACLGLGLLFLGRQEAAETTLEALMALKGPYAQYAALTVESCAYAASGNVLKVQKFLTLCTDHLKEDNLHQGVAVLGIAMVAIGEELGAEMTSRALDHMLQYGETNVRRVVPLSLGMLHLSNPKPVAMDVLSKLSHDSDAETSQCAIFGLGLIGAGTNNSRIAALLRQLSAYYAKEPNHLFIVRLAQGLLHMGKGLLSLSPLYSDRLLTSNVGLAGLLTVFHSLLDIKTIVLGKFHFLLYSIALSIYPRMLITLDENLAPLPVQVRVGQAVDVVGQAGRPKTITGFQTHTSPVLLNFGDRAELATEEYIAVAPILEGFAILKPNPDFKKE